jgi:glycosyltransferase involved in cell wall biosynthesis
MRFAIRQLELSQPLDPIDLAPDEEGLALIGRWHDRLIGFRMIKAQGMRCFSADALTAIADEAFATPVLSAAIEAERPARPALPLPTLTIAICTKDRAVRLQRLLNSIMAARAGSPFAATNILVVDNAPSDDSTRTVAASLPGVRYVSEPKAGLNFARNTALANATGDLLAFLDDDVVVDRHYLLGLATAWQSAPDAGGFTGLVLPFRLDTEAQICFEERGGFGRGFARREFHATSFAFPLHPAGAGLLGAGCNMAFDRALLHRLGGFDDALDTGRPLPGGGDLDIFYRVLRAGRAMVYEPRYAVFHEHRETVAQLRHQYWTWGLGMMAFLVKSWRTDGDLRPRHRALVRWWLLDQVKSVAGAAARLRLRDLRFRFAELIGGIQGLFGEYDRSMRRVAAIRDRFS